MASPAIAQRQSILDAGRRLKMARSAHAYVRGNTAKFYEWLEASPAARQVPAGPAIWICGDCHLGNLGPLADGAGRVEVQIRDLDQAVIGNPAHDLIRLGLSLATAARGSDLPGVATARMIEAMVEGYEAAMRDPVEGDAGPEPDVVRSVRRRALGRRWRHLAKERLDAVAPVLPIGRRFWVLDETERAALEVLFGDPAIVRMILALSSRGDAGTVKLIDAAYWMKGCSSLGLLRFAVVVSLRGERGKTEYALIDIKEAVAPIAPSAPGAAMPAEPGERVVAAARALSPHLGSRMTAARLLDRSVFLRELAPQDLKLEVDQFSQSQAVKAAYHLAFVVGKAHARQMSEDVRRGWLATLQRGRTGAIDAPSWMWSSVVSLAGSHEAGYLEHCRLHALQEAKAA